MGEDSFGGSHTGGKVRFYTAKERLYGKEVLRCEGRSGKLTKSLFVTR